jgi:hypothetical protein
VDEEVPVIFDHITRLSPEASVLAWVVSGRPTEDGTPLFGPGRSTSKKKKGHEEEDDDEGGG